MEHQRDALLLGQAIERRSHETSALGGGERLVEARARVPSGRRLHRLAWVRCVRLVPSAVEDQVPGDPEEERPDVRFRREPR